MGLDTKTHNLFLDTADFAPAPAPTADRPHPPRPAIQGTFHVLVYGRVTDISPFDAERPGSIELKHCEI